MGQVGVRIMSEQKASDAVREHGRQCRETWGLFIPEADLILLDHYINQKFLSKPERAEVISIVDWTNRRASKKRAKANRSTIVGVDWTEEKVASYIQALTGLDQDHARLLNARGWGATDSPAGHWCAAMLKIDRAAAIKIGRGIVGKYQGQLEGSRK